MKKVKLLTLSEKEKENAMSEIRILASIRNPNVIAYKECFIDFPSNSLWFVKVFIENINFFIKIALLWSFVMMVIFTRKSNSIRNCRPI